MSQKDVEERKQPAKSTAKQGAAKKATHVHESPARTSKPAPAKAVPLREPFGGTPLTTVATVLTDLSARMMRTAASLGPAMAAVEVDASPQMVRAARAQEIFYDRIEATFELLTAREAGRRMGSTAARPDNLATQARKAGRLVALERGSRLLFPGWQFDVDGQPLAQIHDLRALGAELGRSERGLIEWVSAPNALFDGDAPATRLASDPDLVLEIAANSWSVEW